MKFEQSLISKQNNYTTKSFDFGKVYFFEKFMISELDYGIHLNWTKIEDIIDVALSHYGTNCKIGYISNKINSYSFEPNLWQNFYEKYDFIVASVSVCYTEINIANATIENHFSKKVVKRTDNLEESIDWILSLDELKS